MPATLSSEHLKARLFSLAIPACMDGMVYMVLAALPLLAIRMEANSLFLGLIGATGQVVRLPACLVSGSLSDRIGRRALIVPAAAIATLACFTFVYATSKLQLLGINIILMIALGAYYPALEALLGDRSAPDQLRRNLMAFNIGWSVGGTGLTLLSAHLLQISTKLPFYAGTCLGVSVLILSLVWSKQTGKAAQCSHAADDPLAAPAVIPNARLLLLISRISMMLAYAGIGSMRYVFPKLCIGLHISETNTAALQGLIIAGMGAGTIVAGMSSWWRGKFWPLLVCQGMMMVLAAVIYKTAAYPVFAGTFLIWGLATGVIYTASIYYALHGREDMGKNAGIHESLTAAGPLVGSFGGGLLAQMCGERSPYIWLTVLSACVIAAVAIMAQRRSRA